MTASAMHYRVYDLPWSVTAEDRQRFRRIFAWVASLTLLAALAIPWLPLPEADPTVIEDVPPRLARFVLERRPTPPKPPVVQERRPEPEPVRASERRPEPEPEARPRPVVQPQAREQAAMAGLLPFADELAALRDSDVVANVTKARPLSGAPGEAARVERALISSKVGSGSGGIDTAALSRNTGGGGGLSGRATTQVSSPVNAGGGPDVSRSGQSRRAARTPEEIEMVFDRNKGAIYALYQRALRSDPTLQGKLVLRLTIAPSGAVTDCEVVSSELGDPELERKLVARVKMFKFEAKDVESITTTKPIDFFPA